MTITISRQTEARLAEAARRRGLTIEALLDRMMNEDSDSVDAGVRPVTTELPVWHLGGAGSLRREEIYDDAD